MIYGLLIGICAVLPGISGGVIAVILGVYDKIIFSINNLNKDNVWYLLKIIIGGIIGVIISSKILIYFLSNKYIEINYLFMGLILGIIPFLIKKYNEKCSERINYYLLIVIMILSLLLTFFIKENLITKDDNIFMLFLSGLLFSFGKVIPGISSSILLSLIGKYRLFLDISSSPINYLLDNLLESVIIISGFLFGLVISLKMMSYLLKKYYCTTYSIITGFVLGSIFIMYPGIITISGILFMIIGFIISLVIPIIKR